MPDSISDNLIAAADEILGRGWRQGDGWPSSPDDCGPVCLEGALLAARGMAWAGGVTRVDIVRLPEYRAVAQFLGGSWAVTDVLLDGLWRWNDAEGRTADDVVAVLRAAALVEAARERDTAAVGS